LRHVSEENASEKEFQRSDDEAELLLTITVAHDYRVAEGVDWESVKSIVQANAGRITIAHAQVTHPLTRIYLCTEIYISVQKFPKTISVQKQSLYRNNNFCTEISKNSLDTATHPIYFATLLSVPTGNVI
jgi:hypothetical protein